MQEPVSLQLWLWARLRDWILYWHCITQLQDLLTKAWHFDLIILTNIEEPSLLVLESIAPNFNPEIIIKIVKMKGSVESCKA